MKFKFNFFIMPFSLILGYFKTYGFIEYIERMDR